MSTSKDDLDGVLALLRSSPAGMTAAELERELGLDKTRVQAAVRSAVALRLVEGHKDPTARANYRRARYVHVAHTRSNTPARALSWRDGPTYKGEDWASACARPGCLDHEQYGSRRGSVVVPYRAPITFLQSHESAQYASAHKRKK